MPFTARWTSSAALGVIRGEVCGDHVQHLEDGLAVGRRHRQSSCGVDSPLGQSVHQLDSLGIDTRALLEEFTERSRGGPSRVGRADPLSDGLGRFVVGSGWLVDGEVLDVLRRRAGF